ncbi:MAG: transcriptional repressor [Comamonadaceae bacterium]|nr:MAG: transcriptional repressor [Comamonadaceae bacterium]
MERFTRQRTAIQAAIADANRPLTAQEILEGARLWVEGLGMATVYRNLKALLDDGEIQTVHLPGENPRYESAGHAHHHHFQCTVCTRAFDVHACPGNLQGLAPKGFTVESHDLTLYGRCADCAPQPR